MWRSGFFAHSCCRIETCERRNLEEFCVPFDDKRRESLRRTVSEQESDAHASLVVFFPGWWSRVRWCSSGGCSFERMFVVSMLAARQHMREAHEMGHCRVDGEGTYRWPRVMKGDASGCPLCDWTGLTGRTIENKSSTAICLNQHPYFCHSDSQD